MPKILIAQSQTTKSFRRAATSSINLKALLEKRLEKNPDDKVWTVVTLNQKMKLKNVVTLMNSSISKLSESEGVISRETYTVNPDKERGKWTIEAAKGKSE